MGDSYLESLHSTFPHLQPARPALGMGNWPLTAVSLPTDLDPQLAPLIQWQPLAEGRSGTVQTLELMKQKVNLAVHDPDFQSFVEAWFPHDSSLGKLDTFVRTYYRYREENEEVYRTPQFMMKQLEEKGYLEGDCDDIAGFYAAILKTQGYRVRFVAIRYSDDTSGFQHVFTEALDAGGQWQIFDATVQPGTRMFARESLLMEV